MDEKKKITIVSLRIGDYVVLKDSEGIAIYTGIVSKGKFNGKTSKLNLVIRPLTLNDID